MPLRERNSKRASSSRETTASPALRSSAVFLLPPLPRSTAIVSSPRRAKRITDSGTPPLHAPASSCTRISFSRRLMYPTGTVPASSDGANPTPRSEPLPKGRTPSFPDTSSTTRRAASAPASVRASSITRTRRIPDSGINADSTDRRLRRSVSGRSQVGITKVAIAGISYHTFCRVPSP